MYVTADDTGRYAEKLKTALRSNDVLQKKSVSATCAISTRRFGNGKRF
jgi:hypothetical protein